MGITGNPEFLLQAQRLIASGRLDQAAEKLALYRDDCYKVPLLPTEYYRLRAIVELLRGNTDDAEGFIRDGGGLTLEFFERYEQAYITYARRIKATKVSRWSLNSARSTQRNNDKFIKVVQMNYRQLIALSQDLPIDPYQRSPQWLDIESTA